MSTFATSFQSGGFFGSTQQSRTSGGGLQGASLTVAQVSTQFKGWFAALSDAAAKVAKSHLCENGAGAAFKKAQQAATALADAESKSQAEDDAMSLATSETAKRQAENEKAQAALAPVKEAYAKAEAESKSANSQSAAAERARATADARARAASSTVEKQKRILSDAKKAAAVRVTTRNATQNMEDALAELEDIIKDTSSRQNEAQLATSRASTQYYTLSRKRDVADAAVHNGKLDVDRLRSLAAKADADLDQKSAQDAKARKELAAAKQGVTTALDAMAKADEREEGRGLRAELRKSRGATRSRAACGSCAPNSRWRPRRWRWRPPRQRQRRPSNASRRSSRRRRAPAPARRWRW